MHKNVNHAKTNQPNKIKRTKNNKGNNFLRRKTPKRGKIVCFAFWSFFFSLFLRSKVFYKNIKQA